MNSIELFAGGGGLALGLANCGFHHKAVVELNKDACRTIRANSVFDFGKSLYEGSVVNFDYLSISDEIDLISGGPPCQPFSLGGKAKGNEDSRDMFPQAVRAIREKRPKAFVFENVKGIMRKSFVDYFEYIVLQLQYPSFEKHDGESWEQHRARLERYHTQCEHTELEYKVIYRLVNAADYGVPQKRERVFFIGFRSDIDANWTFPDPTHSEDALLWDKWISGEYWERHNLQMPVSKEKVVNEIKKIRKKYGIFKPESLPWVTVRDALSDLPDPKSKKAIKYNQHLFKDGAKIYPGHTGSYIDEPSKALKAGAHGVPGGENMIRFEDGNVRYFTVRESARIQTFPDSFNFEGSWGEIMRQLGNAVPARLAEQVGQSVFRALVEQSTLKAG
ncbi:DNA cytosine methyltransferase [Photobacterium iliopiscarium]|uniref:DNA cytosine methyltransferase n=1 Tax=Photobacterium iliopiscarium TaxID=56192 RepID=UPI000D172E5F|nr:DNA cytosine methyltransferase [Photobacterium iliopiscarium]PSU01362.1 DNA (cytosine-5-)-methyltransferase [Photobacterium iliopiscarium]PSV83730.1 DNA (cytosine-5-)-methyltransferase [Photobacterium iliopiscarium]